MGAGSPQTSGEYRQLSLGATPVQLYRSQPYLLAVVDFLARNIAQLGIHVYERLSDTDRVRSTDSVTAWPVVFPEELSLLATGT